MRKKQILSYEVIQRRLTYNVYEVSRLWNGAGEEIPGLYYRLVYASFKLDRAEQAARGMVDGSWAELGPVLGSYKLENPTEPVYFREPLSDGWDY